MVSTEKLHAPGVIDHFPVSEVLTHLETTWIESLPPGATPVFAVTILTETDEFQRFRSNVLLVQEPTSIRNDFPYGPPGGGIKNGESPKEAARREILEEMGFSYSGELRPAGYLLAPKTPQWEAHCIALFTGHLSPETTQIVPQEDWRVFAGTPQYPQKRIPTGEFIGMLAQTGHLDGLVSHLQNILPYPESTNRFIGGSTYFLLEGSVVQEIAKYQ